MTGRCKRVKEPSWLVMFISVDVVLSIVAVR